MARTESVTFQVHPNDEQEQIELMQKFHWSLLSSQEIKTIDNHLERRGDDIYQVTNTERYAKLTFNRALDLPNLTEIKKLEQQYLAVPYPKYPVLFPGGFLVWLFTSAWCLLWFLYFFLSYKPKKEEAERVSSEGVRKRSEILSELEKFD